MADSSPIETFDQAVAFLLGLVRDEPRPYQARAALAQHPVRALLARIGDPHLGLPAVHIAGSKGKGSTALYLEAILEAAGMRTATFTSPHLQRWTERYRIDGRESTPAELTAMVARLQPHVQALQRENEESAPSFFDVLTAAAFLLFAEQGVDCAIIETGIGGRLDATNVVQPYLACITSVELEHTDKLGNTISAIAREKAGIIKAGVSAIIGTLPEEAESVMRARAERLGVKVGALGRDIGLRSQPLEGGDVSIQVSDAERTYHARLPAPAPRCKAHNAALAIACAHRIAARRGSAIDGAVATALADTQPPGRMEVLGRQPWIVADGAHTHGSSRALADMLSELPARRLHLVISLSAARDAAAVLAPLLEGAHRVVITNAEPSRSLDGRSIATRLVAGGFDASRVCAIPDPRRALLETRAELARDDVLCVAGSMYMAGIARETFLGDAGALRHTA
jgi:dihydrofolate synthase/folylpolyglutamate synthase